jgi:hypothetical protein
MQSNIKQQIYIIDIKKQFDEKSTIDCVFFFIQI